MSILLNRSVCCKRFPLSPTKICLLWEEILLKHKDDIEFKNVNDVVTKRTPSCLVHWDISKSSDCIASHGCGSRKWIMLRNGRRWACKHSPISCISPLPPCIHHSKMCFSVGKRSLEPGEWGGFWGPQSIPTLPSLSVFSCSSGWVHNGCTANPKEG